MREIILGHNFSEMTQQEQTVDLPQRFLFFSFYIHQSVITQGHVKNFSNIKKCINKIQNYHKKIKRGLIYAYVFIGHSLQNKSRLG